MDAYRRPNLRGSAAVFQRRDKNVIDCVEPAGSSVDKAASFDNLRLTGVEASAAREPRRGQFVSVGFSGLHGVNAAADISESRYTFNYPVEDAVAVVQRRGYFGGKIVARSRPGVVNRVGCSPYAVWDASAAYATGRLRPFLQATDIAGASAKNFRGWRCRNAE